MLKRQDRNKLTARESQVLELAGGGLNSKQIGERLGISFRTVKTHIHNIRIKTSARSMVRIFTATQGLITSNEVNEEAAK